MRVYVQNLGELAKYAHPLAEGVVFCHIDNDHKKTVPTQVFFKDLEFESHCKIQCFYAPATFLFGLKGHPSCWTNPECHLDWMECWNSELFIAGIPFSSRMEDFRFSLLIVVASCNFRYGSSVSLLDWKTFLNWKDYDLILCKVGFFLPAEQGHSVWWNSFFPFLISLKQHAPLAELDHLFSCDYLRLCLDWVWILLRQAMCNLPKTVFQFCFLSLFKGFVVLLSPSFSWFISQVSFISSTITSLIFIFYCSFRGRYWVDKFQGV